MKPLFLSIKDFTNHGSSIIDFLKISQAIAIVGKKDGSSKKSNAVGKTNIFNAIQYVLFNSKISNAKEKVIRNGTAKCSVCFIFELSDGNIYKIERGRTKTIQNIKIYLKADDEFVDISEKTSSQTDEKIIKIIGINESTFINSSYLKQNDFKRRKIDNLASATPEDRKAIIIDMLQLGKWGKFEKKAKEYRDNYSMELNKINSLIETAGNPKQVIKEKIEIIKNLNEKAAENEKNITELTKELETYNEKLNNLKNSKSNELPELNKKLNNGKIEYKKIQNDLKELNSQYKKWENELKNIHILIRHKEDEINKINEKLESYKADPVIDISELERFLNKTLTQISKLQTDIRSNKSILTLMKKPVPLDESCKECGTNLTKDVRTELSAKKEGKCAELEKLIVNDQAELDKLVLDKSLAENDIKKYNQKNENINKLNLALGILVEEIPVYNKALEEKEKFFVSSVKDVDKKEKLLIEINNEIVELNKEISLIDNDEIDKNIKNISVEIQDINSQLVSCKSNLSTISFQKGQAQAILDMKEKQLIDFEKYSGEKKNLEKNVLIYKSAANVFSSKGVPAMIINAVLESLQNETNKLMELLMPGLQLEFIINKENDKGVKTDTLDIKYFIENLEYSIEDLSGGQQSCVVLAMKLATANISRKRCASDIKLLMLDEPTQPLDEASVENFYNVVADLSKDMTILIITHDKELKKKFKSIIMVEQINGVSKAEGKND